MKKLLFLLLMLPGLAFGATRTWSSAASTNMNLATNYDGAGDLLITDDLVFNNTSVVNAAATAALSVNSVTIASNYTGTWALTGYTLTCATGFSDDGITGAHNYGNGIACNGASNTFHVGAGVASVTAASCVLTMTGTTAMVCDIDKATAFGPLTLGAAAVVTYSGAAVNTFYSTTTTPLIIGNGASLTVNNADVYFRRATLSGDIYSLPAAYTLNGDAGIHFEIGTAGLTMNAPAFTYAGTGNIYFSIYSNRANTVWNQTGNINTGVAALYFYISNAANIHAHTTNGYSVTCGVFYSDIQTAGGVMTLNCGASVFTVSQFAASWNNAGYALNMQTSTWFCSGNLTFGSNHTINPGTSIVTLNGTAAQVVTSNGKSFYDLTVNNSGSAIATAVSFADSATLTGDMVLTDGPVNANGIGIKAVDYTYTTADSVRSGRLWLSGNYTRAEGASKCDTSGQKITFLAGASHVMAAANKVYAKVTANAPLTINGGATIALFTIGTGVKATFEAAKKTTIGELALSANDTLQSSSAGNQDTIATAKDTTALAVWIKDQYFTNAFYLDSAANTLGGNTNGRSLSYTGGTLSGATGSAGDTVFLYTGNGLIAGGATIGDSAVVGWTVISGDAARFIVPDMPAGLYTFTVWNSDADTLTKAGAFTYASTSTIKKRPYGYGYKKYRY